MSKLFIFRELDGTSAKGLLPIGHYPDFRFPTESQDDWDCCGILRIRTRDRKISPPRNFPLDKLLGEE
jgi:hypothetical protein